MRGVSERPHHRPSTPGATFFEAKVGDDDPTEAREAADRVATLLVRGARHREDQEITDRVLHLADTEGLPVIADLWAAAPADSLAGGLWRLYLLRSWVYADPHGVVDEFDAGRVHAPVSRVISGVAEPPRPDDLKAMIDQVLRGVVESDFADVLLRAAAFARVVASGRAALQLRSTDSALRMQGLAEQLDRAARLELDGRLA